MKTKENKPIFIHLIDKVDDGFNYFNGYRLEELKEDDVYYIKSFMDYIEELESKTSKLTKQIKTNER
tara:strand:- start:235 stop:435 length:201 start_codon:yes stop_codon:yes gene_type:complete